MHKMTQHVSERKCKYCGFPIPEELPSRIKYCSDKCREDYNQRKYYIEYGRGKRQALLRKKQRLERMIRKYKATPKKKNTQRIKTRIWNLEKELREVDVDLLHVWENVG